ncbi:hypothetical protein F3Y22_tig00113337pilonHSYRG00175 [Hibiscus syriacus]|uniref:RNase H type-1 domain-containing protein n=1 Tax=Hibiscus syriacus TaxID=106335 RepID=A0A6A2WPH6_HIBSY|nr:hypothetical protein F3Y22_tig00113337pilonHSYRG00175 [Hibiscus syriacus]
MSHAKVRNLTPNQWQKQPAGWFCLNIDGSVSPVSNFGSVGGVVRDHVGNWIIGFHKAVGITAPLQAELWAILQGLEVAWSHGFELLLIQSDFADAVIVNLVNDPNSSLSPTSLSNSLADGIAKLPSPLMHDVALFSSPLVGLQDVFSPDMSTLSTVTQA